MQYSWTKSIDPTILELGNMDQDLTDIVSNAKPEHMFIYFKMLLYKTRTIQVTHGEFKSLLKMIIFEEDGHL